MSKTKKKIGRYLGGKVLRIIVVINGCLSLKCMYKFADMLGDISYFLLKKHYRRAMNNLNLVYGKSLTLKKKKALIRRVFRNFAYSVCEIGYFFKKDTKEITKLIKINGEEHLKEAVNKKNGVIMIGAHIGNFPFIELKLNSLGYPYAAFMRESADAQTEDLFQQIRDNWKVSSTLKLDSRDAAAKKAFFWLKRKNILGIYIDQKFGKGIMVDFLGHPALTAPGAAIYAVKTRVPVIPMFIIRQKDHTHKIFIEPPVKVENTGDKEKDISLTMTNFTRVVEKYVRQYPEQWFWLHRRWKGANNVKKNY